MPPRGAKQFDRAESNSTMIVAEVRGIAETTGGER
jgi:hypothetical protein